MDFGLQMIFQNSRKDVTDAQVYDEEIRLALLAEQVGFDALWPVEHHFTDYAFCPDNTQFLSYLAARTERIKLATGAVILPWNQPIRVVEKIALLDHLSGGRALFGMGRGLARSEYEGMGIDMDTSRERFDEAADMIISGLETGVVEGDGPFYPQKRTEVRPRPRGTIRDRLYSVAMSPDSVLECAKIGARMVMFSQAPLDQVATTIATYRSEFRKHHHREPPPALTCDFTYCHEDAGRAEEMARKYIPRYLIAVLNHYELMSDHFKKAKGYESYGSAVDLLRDVGLDAMGDAFLSMQVWGTPEQIVEKIEARRAAIGDFDLNVCFRYSDMPYEDVEKSLTLFGREVLPAMRRRVG